MTGVNGLPLILWDELRDIWNDGDFDVAHDWLNERWGRIVQVSVQGDRDPLARFMQALAFTALAFHFAREHNYESARLFVDDALVALPPFTPVHLGLRTQILVDRLEFLDRSLPGIGDGRLLAADDLEFGKLIFEKSRIML